MARAAGNMAAYVMSGPLQGHKKQVRPRVTPGSRSQLLVAIPGGDHGPLLRHRPPSRSSTPWTPVHESASSHRSPATSTISPSPHRAGKVTTQPGLGPGAVSCAWPCGPTVAVRDRGREDGDARPPPLRFSASQSRGWPSGCESGRPSRARARAPPRPSSAPGAEPCALPWEWIGDPDPTEALAVLEILG
jgi:hypothetical protein